MRALLLRLAGFFGAWAVGAVGWSGAAQWLPVDLAEFELSASPIDPEAGAEILARETQINGSSYDQTVTTHYVRTRIYSERGVEKLSKIELAYSRLGRIREVEARTIKPDGTILELDRDDVFDREVLKSGNERIKVKSFAPPGIEPGVIVEYRYKQVTELPAWYFALWFQGELPVRRVKYRVRTMEGLPIAVRALFFNCPDQALERDRAGYFNFELTNLPAAEEEPLPPPEIQRQAVALLYYIEERSMDLPAAEHWRQQAAGLHKTLEKEGKVTKQIRAAAQQIVAANDAPEEKLRKLFVHCRTQLRNRDYPSPNDVAPDTKVRANRNATDTLRNGSGSSDDITLLFASLARAVGIDARLARCNDRDLIFFDPTLAAPFTVTDVAVAARLDEGWRYYMPGNPYLPPGMLPWNNTATKALISDPKEARFEDVPASESAASRQERVGSFKLAADGTLEGDVTITYTGHWGADVRAQFAPEPSHKHEEFVRDEVRRNLKLAEVTRVLVKNLTDPEHPMTVAFHLRVPEYAERTGSRFFLQPAVFQKGELARFTAPKRKTDVVFRYRSVEVDDISIDPPDGYEIEAGSSPADLTVGNLATYDVSLGVTRVSRVIKYRREFALGGLFVRQATYEPLKAVFEAMHERDNHVLTLKRVEPPDAAPAASPAAPAASEPTAPASAR